MVGAVAKHLEDSGILNIHDTPVTLPANIRARAACVRWKFERAAERAAARQTKLPLGVLESDPLDDIDIDLDDLDDIDPELAALGFTKRELEEIDAAFAGLEDK